MTFVIAYWLFLIITLGVSWIIGSAETRRAIVAIISVTICTTFAQVMLDREALSIAILIMDTVLLSYFVALALRSAAFWPMWFAALCGLGVLTSATAYLLPAGDNGVYENYAGFWAIPALLILLIGSILDARVVMEISASTPAH